VNYFEENTFKIRYEDIEKMLDFLFNLHCTSGKWETAWLLHVLNDYFKNVSQIYMNEVITYLQLLFMKQQHLSFEVDITDS